MKTTKLPKVKTIDVNAKEWFDRVNGNSYFAGIVTVNYGTKSERVINMPFQYGYGDSYKDQAVKALIENGYFQELKKEFPRIWELRDKGIIIRTHKTENCKKRELMQY